MIQVLPTARAVSLPELRKRAFGPAKRLDRESTWAYDGPISENGRARGRCIMVLPLASRRAWVSTWLA